MTITATRPRAVERRHAGALPWVLGVGLVLRLALLARDGHAFDMSVYASWSHTLASRPWSDFYAVAQGPDHLPGDVVLHGILARGYEWFGGTAGSAGYVLLVRLVAIGADLLCAALLAALLAPRLGRRAPWVAAGYLLCPASWLISAGWGQWDAVGLAIVLAALVVLTRRPDGWWAGVALLAWAVLVKPQLALVAGPAVVGLVLANPLVTVPTSRSVLRRAVACLAVGLTTAALLCSPFAVGLPAFGARWSLAERVRFAADRFDAMTLGAANVWSFASTPGAPDAARIGPLSAQTTGSLLVLGVVLLGGFGWWRRRQSPLVASLAWGATNLLAFYLLATRCHERYLLPALVLGVALAALDRGYRTGAVAVGVVLSVVIARCLFSLRLGSAEPWVDRVLAVVLLGALASWLTASLSAPTSRRPPAA